MSTDRVVQIAAGAVFALAGLLLISLSHSLGEREREFAHAGMATTGTVDQHLFEREQSSEGGSQTAFSIAFRYTVNGNRYTARQRVDDLRLYPVGKPLVVYYSAIHPGDAALEKPAGSGWLLLLGGCIAVLGAALLASALIRRSA